MKNDQAFVHLTSSIRKKKKPRKPTEAHIIAQMKQYLIHQDNWKMAQLKGNSYAEIKLHYYSAYRKNTLFAPIGSEKEAGFIKRHAEHMESSRAKKKSKRDEQAEKLSEEQLDTMVRIEEQDFFPEPLQVRHPIVDWDIF